MKKVNWREITLAHKNGWDWISIDFHPSAEETYKFGRIMEKVKRREEVEDYTPKYNDKKISPSKIDWDGFDEELENDKELQEQIQEWLDEGVNSLTDESCRVTVKVCLGAAKFSDEWMSDYIYTHNVDKLLSYQPTEEDSLWSIINSRAWSR